MSRNNRTEMVRKTRYRKVGRKEGEETREERISSEAEKML